MPRKTILELGPSYDSHIEPPVEVPVPLLPTGPSRRQLAFQAIPTSPGGQCHLVLLPPMHDDDVMPITVYAFFCNAEFGPPVPAQPGRKPEWFFTSGHPSASARIGEADHEGKFDIVVPGVKPSLHPYFVQTVVEFSS